MALTSSAGLNPPSTWSWAASPLTKLVRRRSTEEVHVRLHPEEGLIDGDEAGNVQHPSQIEVLQLQAPIIEEPAQELVCGVS